MVHDVIYVACRGVQAAVLGDGGADGGAVVVAVILLSVWRCRGSVGVRGRTVVIDVGGAAAY